MLSNVTMFKDFALIIILNIAINQKQNFDQLILIFSINFYESLLIFFIICNLLTTNISQYIIYIYIF